MSSKKPESAFISSVHRKLPKGLAGPWFEKMANPYRAGGADCWYSGVLGDLWIEWKFLTKVPVKALILPDLSPLQLDWLASRYNEGRHVAVIVGCPEGGVLYRDLSWLRNQSPAMFRLRLRTREQLAEWIFTHTGARCAPSQAEFSQQPQLSAAPTG